MTSYKPPYTITSKILKSVSDISELISDIKHIDNTFSTLRLRKKNRIRSITGTLQIEGNTFDEEKVSNVINGKIVLGSMREIEEVKGAVKAYDYLEKYNYKNEKDLLKSHSFLMDTLLTNAGSYRNNNVGVGTHIAPPPKIVPQLMKDLFDWLKNTDEHLLIVSCVFHYEFEFVHPFSDGNGRIGRLWQIAILKSFKDLFAHIPIESMVRDNQKKYYQALEKSTKAGESTFFIEFLLDIISKSLKEYIKESKKSDQKSDQKIIEQIKKNNKITIKELSEKTKLSESGVKKIIKKLKEKNLLIRVGSLKGGHWETSENK